MSILETAGETSTGASTSTSTQTQVDSSQQSAPQVPEWLKGVDPEFANDPSIKTIQDIPSLVKGYVNAQKMVGKDKVIIPTANSSAQEWAAFHQKMGLPELSNYAVDFGENDFISADDAKELSAKAHSLGIQPKQLKEIGDYFLGKNKAIVDQYEASKAESMETTRAELQKEWGDGYAKKLYQANAVIKQFGGENMLKHLEESGAANDGNIIRFLAKIGESITKEDTFPQEVRQSFNMTPEEANAEIQKIMGDINGAYFNKSHAEHQITVDRMQKLYAIKEAKSRV